VLIVKAMPILLLAGLLGGCGPVVADNAPPCCTLPAPGTVTVHGNAEVLGTVSSWHRQ